MHTKYQVGSQVSEDVVNVKSNRPGRPRHLNGKRCAITTDSSWLGTFADADGAGRGLIACVCRRMRAVLKSRRPKKQVCATSAYCPLPTALPPAARAARVEPMVISRDSLGMLVTKGLISQPNPVGMSRVREIDSHST